MFDTIEKIKIQARADLIEIGVYMQQTMGFPVESYIEEINQMNFIDQLYFCLKWRKKHSKNNPYVI